MNRFNFWGASGSSISSHGPSQTLSVSEEIKELEDSMGAVKHIMNDDIDAANTVLDDGSSAFHKVRICYLHRQKSGH